MLADKDQKQQQQGEQGEQEQYCECVLLWSRINI